MWNTVGRGTGEFKTQNETTCIVRIMQSQYGTLHQLCALLVHVSACVSIVALTVMTHQHRQGASAIMDLVREYT